MLHLEQDITVHRFDNDDSYQTDVIWYGSSYRKTAVHIYNKQLLIQSTFILKSDVRPARYNERILFYLKF